MRTPLNLSGRELGGLVAEAIAAVLSLATLSERSLELDLRIDFLGDSLGETGLSK